VGSDIAVVLGVLAAVIAVALAVPAALFARMAVLRRRGATLSCALRLGRGSGGSGGNRGSGGNGGSGGSGGRRWQIGLVRYSPRHVQWFRLLGVGFRPSLTLRRRTIVVLDRHAPAASELHSMPHDSVIASCRGLTLTGRSVDVDIAMPAGAMTGFLSWLESAPPGAHQPQRPA
jgi:hypothetical protein